jgi:hypothetical protein
MRPSAHRRASAGCRLALLATALVAAACGGADLREATIRGEKLMLQKEIDGLHTLIGALQRGTLTRNDQLLIGADEATVERLIAVTLPQERLIAKRFRIRLEKAKVQFRGNLGLVTLTGRATAEDAPATFVDVVLKGALNDLIVARDSGALTGRVAIYTLEVQRAAAVGAENRTVRELAKALGQSRVDSFSELGPTVVIPIRLHEDLDFHGLDQEPVSAAPGSLHVQLSVAKVIAVSGRLWVMVNVVAGPWLTQAEEKAH